MDGEAFRDGLQASSHDKKTAVTIKERERTNRDNKKRKYRHDLEMRGLEVQQIEAERQHAHEMAMLDRRLQMEQIRMQNMAALMTPHKLPASEQPGAPTGYLFPPPLLPHFTIDPDLAL
jgi:hypothetical protein